MDFVGELYPNSESVFGAAHGEDVALDAAPGVLGDLDVHAVAFEMSSPIVSSSSSFESDSLFTLDPHRAMLAGKLKATEVGVDVIPTKQEDEEIITPSVSPLNRKRKVDQVQADKLDAGYLLQDLPRAIFGEDNFEDTFVEAKRRMDHNTHTRKSREKLNDKFERLVRVLPKVGNDKDMKHKAQILEHSLSTLEKLLNENKALEMELALLSRNNTVEWVKTVVDSAKNETEVFIPLLKLICLKSPGCFGEMWKVSADSKYTIIGAASSKDLDNETRDVAANLAGTSAEPSGEPLVRHCFTSMRSCCGNQRSHIGAELRWCRGVSCSLAVPIIYSGRVNIVATFYSASQPFDRTVVETSELGATCLGNYYTSKLRRMSSKSPL
mmetsp:Transcript_5697/g.16953  ORF Transcript_5697/g.16953 Transcript_5697/m.16953 type:complete len:382 (+) Transcript_5697:227-1372(+)